MSAPYEFVVGRQWRAFKHRVHCLSDGETVDELFILSLFQDQWGRTAIMYACLNDAPLEVVQLIMSMDDSRKRSLLAVTSNRGYKALYCAARNNSDPAVLGLLIREYPPAVLGLQWSIICSRLAAITSLLTDSSALLASHDYERLVTLIGTSSALDVLVAPSRILVALACLKRSRPAFYDHDGECDTARVIFSFL